MSVASVAVTLYVVARRVWPEGDRAGALSVASVALPVGLLLEPVLETFKFGQVNLVLMALVAVDCLVEHPRWPRGLLVGLAAAIKLTPAAFVLFFLLRRDRRAAVVTVVTAAAATGLGFAVDAASSARYWFGGPAAGVATIDRPAGDAGHREQLRVRLAEPYRTMLGHLRHEIGHRYWEVLVRRTGRLGAFRAVFGDRRTPCRASGPRRSTRSRRPGCR